MNLIRILSPVAQSRHSEAGESVLDDAGVFFSASLRGQPPRARGRRRRRRDRYRENNFPGSKGDVFVVAVAQGPGSLALGPWPWALGAVRPGSRSCITTVRSSSLSNPQRRQRRRSVVLTVFGAFHNQCQKTHGNKNARAPTTQSTTTTTPNGGRTAAQPGTQAAKRRPARAGQEGSTQKSEKEAENKRVASLEQTPL